MTVRLKVMNDTAAVNRPVRESSTLSPFYTYGRGDVLVQPPPHPFLNVTI